MKGDLNATLLSALLVLLPGCGVDETASDVIAEAPLADAVTCATPVDFTFATSGDETIAYAGGQPVAWFTAGSYTVRMVGPSRTFTWGNPVSVTIPSTAWVRTLTAPFQPEMSPAAMSDWVNAARAVSCAAPTGTQDILSIAFDYVEGAPLDAGHIYGADFNDYLGVAWDPPDGSVRSPDPTQLGKVDCSGYMRLVWGYRDNFTYQGTSGSIPLSMNAVTGMLPRRSYQQYMYGPGKPVVPFRLAPAGASPSSGGTPTPAEVAALRVGDLLFFDVNCDYTVASPSCSADPAVAIGHVGILLGPDTAGNLRFISSRASADGPTIGNVTAWSIVNGATSSTYFPKRFRAARRL